MRVLVVDDNKADLELTQAAIERYPCPGGVAVEVTLAESFDDALRLMQESGPFEGAIVDFNLGAETGVELIQRARDLGLATGTAFCVFTGVESESVEAQARAVGAACVIPKPVGRFYLNAINVMLMRYRAIRGLE